MASSPFVLDIKEKEIKEAKAPSFPQIKPGASGFPEHKKRSKPSAFKQKRQGLQPDHQIPKVPSSPPNNKPLGSSHHESKPAPSGQSFMANEKINIDRENSQKLASMSPQEIEEARRELFSGLDSSILERLLKRANLDEAANISNFDDLNLSSKPSPSTVAETVFETGDAPEIRVEDTSADTDMKATINQSPKEQSTTIAQSDTKTTPPKPYVSDDTDERETPPDQTTDPKNHNPAVDDDSAPKEPPKEHIIDPSAPELEGAHWPRAPQPADLDPSDPNFLQNLHEKYFPSLPADPSKLAWMAPIPTPNSAADRDSPYYPGQDSLPVSALRFDFRGALLPPRISRAVPTSKGLHHHGEAPEAAGYTIRELARLARSAVPGQRCVAYQTLGRILYRLGAGEFGGVHPDDVSMGIWREFSEGAVLRSLHEEVGAEEGRGRGHRSARAYATEAIWLFEKGGWKDRLKKA
ncbi:RPAP1-like protein [Xylaria bambusicola]|uniref:RPAP1-like protein n=1 Tax=Xylaria bambusicola TaxID=326684 RepID=UPI0020085CDD|nr:RPAP1-like protein [Xylaria bambusicola]KAI0516936.1 RPAP1-like protein [Xylaria bambusicola]